MLEVLSIKNLRRLWLGQVLSLIGTRMFGIALCWWILTKESQHAGLKMGALLIVGALPSILFSKYIGRAVDEKNLKNLVIKADLIAGILTLSLALWITFVGEPALPVVYIVSFLLSFSGAIIDPAMNKMISLITPDHHLEKATALVASTSSVSFLIGALIGGASITVLGLKGCIWFNAISYLAAIYFSSRIHLIQNKNTEQLLTSSLLKKSRSPFFPDNFLLRQLLLSFGFVNFFSAPLFVTLPMFVKHILHGSGSILGILEGAIYFGSVLGTLVASNIVFDNKLLKIGAFSVLFMGIFILAIGTTMNIFIVGAFITCAAASIAIGNVKFICFFQKTVPESEKGRFFASLSALANIAYPLSFFLFGYLSDIIYIPYLYLIQGSGVIVLSFRFFQLATMEPSTSRSHSNELKI
jgi:MFS family permease